MLKKIGLWLLCVCLLAGQMALAEDVVDEAELNPAPQVQVLAPYWLDLDNAVSQGQKVSLTAAGELKIWNPFDEDVTALINQLLKHVALEAEYQTLGEDAQFAVDVKLDGESVLAYVQKQTQQGNQWITDLTDTAYIQREGESKLPFMAADVDEAAFSWEDLLLLDGEPENVLYSMIQQVKPLGTPKKADRKLAQIGTAKKVIKVTLGAEETQTILDQAVATLNHPIKDELLKHFTLGGTQYTYEVYQSKDGKDYSLIWSGRVDFGEGDLRKVTLNWRFKEEEGSRLDLISFKAPAVKGSNDLTVKVEWKRTWDAEKHTSNLTCTTNSTLNKDKDYWKVQADLTNQLGEAGHQVTGTVTMETKPEKTTFTTTYTPNLTMTGGDEIAVSGTMGIVSKRAKDVLLDAVLQVNVQTAEGIFQEPAWLVEQVVLDDLSDAETDAALEELNRAIAKRFLLAAMALPAEERQVLMYGISEANQARVEEAFQALQP